MPFDNTIKAGGGKDWEGEIGASKHKIQPLRLRFLRAADGWVFSEHNNNTDPLVGYGGGFHFLG